MRSISTAALPQVVLQHIDAYRSHDPEAFMSTLAPEALVNNIQREFLGHPAIRSWAEKEIFGDNVALDQTKIERSPSQGGNFAWLYSTYQSERTGTPFESYWNRLPPPLLPVSQRWQRNSIFLGEFLLR